MPREICGRCRRPASVCWCGAIRPIESAVRVCFLQHPRERRVPVGTAWMAHLSLPNSELHRGVDFGDNERVREVLADPDAALLFPGPGAVDPAELANAPPRTLVVVDGSWAHARKLVHGNFSRRKLLRVGFRPLAESRYRIRRQPRVDCVSTIEAVAYALGALERDPAKFAPLLAPFDRMVEQQLEFVARRPGPRRTRRPRQRAPRVDASVASLRAAVAIYAESNGTREAPQLLRLSAARLATGERFDAFVAAEIDPHAAAHLEVDAAQFLHGETLASALSRFERFLHPGDVFCGWGPFAREVLRLCGGPLRAFTDVRVAASRRLRRRPSGVEQAARLLGAKELPAPLFDGRAGRRLAALVDVASRL